VLRAAVFAAVAVALLMLLRAKSDGATPSLAIVLASFAAIGAAAWAIGSRERGAFAVLAALLTTQLLLHVGYLFAATGQFAHAGGTGLFCSPASVSSDSCAPTDRGGLLLLAVQLAVALTLAVVMRGADAACWQLARRPKLAFAAAVRWLVALFAAVVLPARVERVLFLVATWVPPRQPRRLLLSHECGRRGPPIGRAISSLVAAPSFS
jgi:hypothetical protein